MTFSGGAAGDGNIFSVGINGSNYRNLLSFTGTGGAATGKNPNGSLTLSGTTLYGVTTLGGTTASGNVFSIGTDGTNYQNLISFAGGASGGTAIGWIPNGNVTLSGTTLYGTTLRGGIGAGNVFSIGMDGTSYQNLVSFTGYGGTASGAYLYGSVTLDGTTLYGMSSIEGNFGGGTIYRVDISGAGFQDIVHFTGTGGTADGNSPHGSLIVVGTTLYGMAGGGAYKGGSVFSVDTDGTNYRDLVSFTNIGGTATGAGPNGSLILSGTTLYGTTLGGGANGLGTIFSVGTDGSGFQNLYSFNRGASGYEPLGDLTLSGGTLFGMTSQGGNQSLNNGQGYGTVFALALPAPTPEPGSLALASTGAAAVVTYRCWRRRRETLAGRKSNVATGKRVPV